MAGTRQGPTVLGGALRLMEVLKATIVHSIRHETSRSSLGFVAALIRPLVLLACFLVIFEISGFRGITIRGSTVTFLLTGIFCFLVHIGTLQKVAQAIRRSRTTLHRTPTALFVQVMAQALAALYLHLFAALVIMLVAELAGFHLGIRHPQGLILPYLLSWASGMGMGMILMAIGYSAPLSADLIGTIYIRLQFFTSGKFWAANVIPAGLADYAQWNPLFHIIDQMRGAAFVNYFPKYTSLEYPLVFTGLVLLLGFMLESRLRRGFSLSRLRR